MGASLDSPGQAGSWQEPSRGRAVFAQTCSPGLPSFQRRAAPGPDTGGHGPPAAGPPHLSRGTCSKGGRRLCLMPPANSRHKATLAFILRWLLPPSQQVCEFPVWGAKCSEGWGCLLGRADTQLCPPNLDDSSTERVLGDSWICLSPAPSPYRQPLSCEPTSAMVPAFPASMSLPARPGPGSLPDYISPPFPSPLLELLPGYPAGTQLQSRHPLTFPKVLSFPQPKKAKLLTSRRRKSGSTFSQGASGLVVPQA